MPPNRVTKMNVVAKLRKRNYNRFDQLIEEHYQPVRQFLGEEEALRELDQHKGVGVTLVQLRVAI